MTESAGVGAAIGSIVVGIDGSKVGIRAALWAVDEAVSRDVPLRLLYAMEPGSGPASADSARAAAETAIRHACTAIEAVGQPVKVETEIDEGPAIESLIRASRSAAMVCVGAVGLRHFQPERVGSTAAALAVSALCPVAIVRGRDDGSQPSAYGIIVELDGCCDNGVLLRAAMEEAQLRGAAVRAVTCWQSGPGAAEGDSDHDRRARANMDRRLVRWRRQYPNIELTSLAVRGSLLDYLARNRDSDALVIVGVHNSQHMKELVGPIGSAILQDAHHSLLIVDRQNL